MSESILDTALIKAGKSVLDYLVSIANDKAANSIEDYLREKRISDLEEAIHKELESMASDSVVLDTVEDFLSKNGISPGSQINCDWYLRANTTKRMIKDFFSLHPEWAHDRDSITPMLERIITATYDAVLSFLSPDGRILSIQTQKNTESVLTAIQNLYDKITAASTEWNSSKYVFKPDLYETYLDKYQDRIFHWFFKVNRDGEKYSPEGEEICKDELFSELERFLSYSWRKKLRENLNGFEKDYPMIVNSIYNISSSFSMHQTIQQIKKTIGAQIDARPKEQKQLESIQNNLANTPYQNCLFISGCHGCGKTRTCFELARHVQNKPEQFGDTVFLFVSSDMSADIRSNIAAEFSKLFPQAHSVDQCLDAFSEDLKLVIVLDDVQRYFQKYIDLEQIFSLIAEYSRSYVKWIILTQPGYCKDPSDMYHSFHEEYGFPWNPGMNRYLISRWFALDMWHRSKDTPGAMISQSLSISQWDWKDKVSTTNYYTPLFANILICYHLRHEEPSIFSRHNLLFPDFCALFYSILVGVPDNMERDVKHFTRIFWELKKLECPLSATPSDDVCDNLINRGLLQKKESSRSKGTIFEGTPDIIWIYKLAESLQENWLDGEYRITQRTKDEEWTDNRDLFHGIVSLVIQIAQSQTEDSARNILKANWTQLLKWGYCEAVIDSGFNCEPGLRNTLIDMLLNKKAVWKNHFDTIMRLCALGKVESGLLLRVISHCAEDFKSQTVTHGYLFANMLQANIPSLSWMEIVYAFSLLRNVLFEDHVPRVIGSILGTALIDHAEKANALHYAIQQAREVSKKSRHKKYGSYPSDLYDWFCASVCDTVIDRYESDGYGAFCLANWYAYKQSPEWEERHRNKALTFALSAHYRYSLADGNDTYTEWFEELLEELKSGTRQEKTFAMFAILHTGLKETGYGIRSNRKLLEFATEILNHNSMESLKNDPGVKRFMKTNQII